MAGESWRPPPDRYRSPPPSSNRDFERRNDGRSERREDYRADHRDRDPYYQFHGSNHPGNGSDNRTRFPADTHRSGFPPHSPRRGSDSYRPNGDNFNFDFRYDAPQSIDMNRDLGPHQVPQRLASSRANNHTHQDSSRRGSRRGREGARGRGGYSRKAADRPFLQTQRAPTPELMAGMDDVEGDGTKYRSVEDMSDSDEIDMDVSSADEGPDDDNVAEQPKKKQARTDLRQAADEDSVPRWSNPDPYTALPPPDESQRKKKDVVKLIRKARVTKTAEETPRLGAAADDFISFDFGDDNDTAFKNDVMQDDRGIESENSKANGYSHRDAILSQIPPLPQPSANALGNYAILQPTSDPSLGNRKRTHDDEIKGPPRYTKKQISAPVDGRVVREWRGNDIANPVPWCINDHSRTVDMPNWLHKEIMDFYILVKPRAFEQTMRETLVFNLRAAVRRLYRDADIQPFGSFVAGLYLPTADMDLVLVSTQFMQGRPGKYAHRNQLFRFKDFLAKESIAAPQSIEVIHKAKVPIVKYVDSLTGLKVDISFENDSGIVANETFRKWKEEFPAMPIIVTLIKQFLTMRGLNEPVNGGIGGFSVICLVVSLLQHMPQVQSQNMIPEHNLGEILMEFLDLYGNRFNTMTNAIQMKPPAYLSKSVARELVYKLNEKAPRFTIIDPNNSANDIAGGSSNTRTLIKVFSEAYTKLTQRMIELHTLPMEKRYGQSILGEILAGDYSSFEEQRRYLEHLHRGR